MSLPPSVCIPAITYQLDLTTILPAIMNVSYSNSVMVTMVLKQIFSDRRMGFRKAHDARGASAQTPACLGPNTA
jgi:hypothetical protein